MSHPGPAPKSPDQRRRRAAPARGDWVDLPAPGEFEIRLPELPAKMPDGDPWPQRTQDAWAAWRSDPATSQYSAADVDYALDTVILHAKMAAGYQVANEVRLRMDALGLTPKGKRDLRYRLPEYTELVEKQANRGKRSKRGSSRRARLEVVQ